MATKKKSLTPPDLERCQAEKPNGHTFMTLGGRPGMERCTNKPTVIVMETEPGDDGQKGSMAICDGCLAVFRKQMPKGKHNIRDIDDTWPERWVQHKCDLCPKVAIYFHTKGGKRCSECPRPTT